MASLRDSIQANKRIMILITALLIILLVFLTKFYRDQKKENQALRIKLLSMSENKRTPKLWSQLTAQPATPLAPAATIAAVPVNPAPAPAAATASEVPVTDQDTQQIAINLGTQMKRVKNLEAADIDNNIAMADELISREPDSYGAYKAKLISLLVKEGKFNQAADDAEVEGLLENMAQFNIGNDKIARREAALIANSNSEIQNAEGQLEDLARERETLESQIINFDANSSEFANLNNRMQEIENSENQIMANIGNLEEGLANNTAQVANEDVVEIPFMRMMAKNDYEGVMENAQNFIDQFPNSASGYFYMVRALELQGQKEEALQIIQNAKLPQDVQAGLIQRIESESGQNPQTYWEKLNF